jgi:thioredoxin 1
VKELIHFTADWCGPCKRIAPIIEEFLINNKDVYYYKVDVDKEFNKAEIYNVQSIPTLISKIDGRIHDRVIGVVSEFTLKSMFS